MKDIFYIENNMQKSIYFHRTAFPKENITKLVAYDVLIDGRYLI